MWEGRFCFGHLSFALTFVTIILTLLPLTLQTVSGDVAYASPNSQIALPGCPDKCGNVSIFYPFGIGDNCHYNHPEDGLFYNITCNESKVPIVPTYGDDIEVVNITLDGEIWIRNSISVVCSNNVQSGVITPTRPSWISVTRFSLSTTKNLAGGIGCNTLGFFTGTRMKNENRFGSGCYTVCSNESDVGNTCPGIGCCVANIPDGITNITLLALSIEDKDINRDFNPCSVAFVGAHNHVKMLSIKSILTQDANTFDNILLVYQLCMSEQLDKKIVKRLEQLKKNICKANSICENSSKSERGYRCKCEPGFDGNPYLHDCQDIDECAMSNHTCEKPYYCVDTSGNYTCQCPKGYYAEGTKFSNCISNSDGGRKKLLLAIIIILGVSGGIIIFLIAAFRFHWQHGNKRIQQLREVFFLQNDGHILLQKLSMRDVALGNMVKMFTTEELKKATNSYNDESIVSRGGFGMVYKGVSLGIIVSLMAAFWQHGNKKLQKLRETFFLPNGGHILLCKNFLNEM